MGTMVHSNNKLALMDLRSPMWGTVTTIPQLRTAASAYNAIQLAVPYGKLKGVIWPTTPMGSFKL